MDDRWIRAALDHINDHSADIISDLQELVRIPSVSGTPEEKDIQVHLAEKLRSLGVRTDQWTVASENLSAAQGFPGAEVPREEILGVVGHLSGSGGGSTLMFNGHVDVVPTGELSAWSGADPFSGEILDGRVIGRGACDMKSGLVAAYWALRTCVELKVPLRGDLLLATVAAEEDGGAGTFALLERGWRADACIIPEPTGLDIVPGNSGALTFRMVVTGLSAHAATRLEGVNAVDKFTMVLRAMRHIEAQRNARSAVAAPRWGLAAPIEIGTVSAGEWSSSVPDTLIAEGRVGVLIGESPASARSEFEDALSAACDRDPWLRDHPVRIEWWGGQFESALTPPDSTVVTELRDASTVSTGRTPAMWTAPYGSDLRLLQNIARIPTVQFGPGDIGVAHGPDEYVNIDEVLDAARTFVTMAIRHCGTVG